MGEKGVVNRVWYNILHNLRIKLRKQIHLIDKIFSVLGFTTIRIQAK